MFLLVCQGAALGLGGIDYLLQCVVETDTGSPAVQWQGLLGRLYVLDQLVQERAMDFRAAALVGGSASVVTEPLECYYRTLLVLRFVARHVSFPHVKAARLTYRVFCQVAALQIAVGGMAIVDEFCQLLDSANVQIQWRIRRKLESLAGDYVHDKPRPSHHPTHSANIDPILFFVSAQPTPQMEVVPDQSSNVDIVVTPESTSQQLQPVVRSADKEVAHSIEASSPPENHFVYDASVVVSKQFTMTDSCVQTSPLLLRRSKMMTAASVDDNNSDAELGASCQMSETFSLHTSDSAVLLDSHGSISVGSHASTDLSDFIRDPQTAGEKVSFKKEVVLAPSVSLEQNEGMMFAYYLVKR